MKADDVCARYGRKKKGVGLTVRMLDQEGGESPMVLIEGKPEALKFLAELLLAVSEDGADASFSLGPSAAGSWRFSKAAELGLYIHST